MDHYSHLEPEVVGMPGTCSIALSKVHIHRHHVSCAKETTQFIPVLAPESLSKLIPSHTYILENQFQLLRNNFLNRTSSLTCEVATHSNLHCLVCLALTPTGTQIYSPIISPQRAPFPRCFATSAQAVNPLHSKDLPPSSVFATAVPERRQGPRSAIDRRGQLLSPALSGSSLDSQGKLGPVSSVIYHRNQELCSERGGG